MSHKNVQVTSLFPKEPPLGLRDFTIDALLTESARQAWQLLLDWYISHRSGVVLIPAYIGFTDREGSGVFDPVKASGVKYRFYAVDEQLFTSVSVLRSELERGDIGVLLVVHWFGLSHVNLPEVRRLCDEFGVLLVEDCAHVLGLFGEGATLGRFGDAAFYSLHKTFGGSSGGVLVWNRSHAGKNENIVNHYCPYDVLTEIFRTDVHAVASHRKLLYAQLSNGLKRVEGLRVMYPDISNHVPHNCAVYVEDGLREKLYFSLVKNGIPVTALYYRLITEIDSTDFPEGHAVSSAILNFPVHQGVPASVLPQVLEVTQTILQLIRS